MKTKVLFWNSVLFVSLGFGGCKKNSETSNAGSPAVANRGSDAALKDPNDPHGKATLTLSNEHGIVHESQTNSPDSQLAQKVRTFLTTRSVGTQGGISEKDLIPVQVRAENGVIVLSGQVQNQRQKQALEASARGFRGVADVRNDLTVSAEAAPIQEPIKSVEGLKGEKKD
jgi:hypothetical protein